MHILLLNSFAHRRQAGLSLVELMVSLVIASLLIIGVIQIFSANSQTYRTQEGVSRVQENTRFAMEVMQRDLRMAGFTGCTRNILNHLDENNPNYSNELMGGPPVTGWEYTGTAPGDSYNIADGDTGNWSSGTGGGVPAAIAGDTLPGSDVVVINFAERANVTLNGNPAANAETINVAGPSGIPQGTIVMATSDNCAAGDLWQKVNQAGANSITKGASGLNESPGQNFMGTPYNDNANVYIWASVAYYVGQGAGGEPALFQRRLGPPAAAAAQELVEGVESMQILYGLDTDGDRQVDSYVTATTVNDWDEVISVRISLLHRSPANNALDVGTLDTRVYNLIGTRINPVDDRRARQVATTTVGLRNRLD
jgi:type IV pilus assembly protein PilW